MLRRVMIAVAVSFVTVGCSGSDDGAEPEPASSNSPTATAEEATPMAATPTTTETEPAGEALAIGHEITTPVGSTAAVLGYEQPVAGDSPQPAEAGYPDGYEWAGLDVRVCVPEQQNPDGDLLVSRTPWVLAYEDGALVESSHTGYAGFPQPEYPWGDQAVAPGQCVRGWIVYAAPGDQRPIGAQYTPGSGEIYTWQLL